MRELLEKPARIACLCLAALFLAQIGLTFGHVASEAAEAHECGLARAWVPLPPLDHDCAHCAICRWMTLLGFLALPFIVPALFPAEAGLLHSRLYFAILHAASHPAQPRGPPSKPLQIA
jgi:hypothetical protein